MWPALFFLACTNKPSSFDDTGADTGTTDTSSDTGSDTGLPSDALPLVPAPLSVVLSPEDSSFSLHEDASIQASVGLEGVAEVVAAQLRPATGFALPVSIEASSSEAGTIRLSLDTSLPEEGYRLTVTPDRVEIAGGSAAGAYWGAQSLRQLFPAEILGSVVVSRDWSAPAAVVEDAPRFGWRGLMLDVARHFFTVDEVKRQIDVMTLYKLNRLHLHLTDDQGWRIEIPAWPDLTRIGGATEVGGGEGGFYTEADYAEIVAYAAARQITVVPEIDLPGHANAALTAYGVLSPTGAPVEPHTGTAVISTPIDTDGPETARFVAEVWASVAAITPGPWLHVGGDEAIDVSDADYATFLHLLHDTVQANGKTLLGWDEIASADLEPPFIAQHWYSSDNAEYAAARGGKILSSVAQHAYWDMGYDADAPEGQIWAGLIDIERAYRWSPVPQEAEEEDVIGVEGALWTELVEDEPRMDFMVWPRQIALAEVGWTTRTSWTSFQQRLGAHGPRLDVLGVNFYASPEVAWE